MPLFSGLSAHSDNKHILSAKKNIPGGVAGLDDTTKIVLAQIPDILTGKDADTLDGKHYAQVATDIGAHAALTSTHGVTGTILGSEDKNAINGIAGLDAAAKIALAQIPDILTGKDADTLDGKHYAQVATDIGAHATLTKTHGVSQTILGSEEKNAANGIAALDAAAKIAYAQLPNLTARINNGYYLGDGSNGRAIAHGLGVVPKLVITMGAGTNSGATLINMAGDVWQEASTHTGYTITMWTSTNFYVDGPQFTGNYPNEGYHWVAFG